MTEQEHNAIAKQVMNGVAAAFARHPEHLRQHFLTMVATTAITLLHGTYGAQFVRDYLRGAVESLDEPDALKVNIEVGSSH